MKKIGTYTCRGTVPGDGTERITLFDGRFDTAYRLVEFRISHKGQSDAQENAGVAKVATEALTNNTEWDWSDNREIGWAYANKDLYAPGAGWTGAGLVDPDNLIIEDCYVITNDQFEASLNYMMVFEKYDISEWQGALSMVRNKSQA